MHSSNESRRPHGLRSLIHPILITAMALAIPIYIFCAAPSRSQGTSGNEGIPVLGYEIVKTYPHDISAFTQGLFIYKGMLYEGTGLNRHSTLRKVDLETGKVLKERHLENTYFGEGIATDGKRIIQLTWRSHKGFVYDLQTFDPITEFTYPTEGWGLAYDGRNFIMSDGSATLYYLDPLKFEEVGRLEVYDDKGPVTRLNELEYVKGEIYANVWGEDRVARIDPDTGHVTAWIDLRGLLTASDRKNKVDVLNGIAYDNEKGKFYVTGKLWPKMFEIKLVPKK